MGHNYVGYTGQNSEGDNLVSKNGFNWFVLFALQLKLKPNQLVFYGKYLLKLGVAFQSVCFLEMPLFILDIYMNIDKVLTLIQQLIFFSIYLFFLSLLYILSPNPKVEFAHGQSNNEGLKLSMVARFCDKKDFYLDAFIICCFLFLFFL